MHEFNVIDPIGSMYENSFRQRKFGSSASKSDEERLVAIICFCLNPNHYHLVLRQVADKGIEKLMHRIGTSHTKYFNNKNKRTGVLFQGKFKAVHIDSNEYLLHVSAYVNLNWRVHQLGSSASKLISSSWDEYVGKGKRNFCDKSVILGQFKNTNEYKEFARSSLESIRERKEELKNIREFLLE